MKQKRVARQGLLRGQELLTEGAYKESLLQNQVVYSMVGENAPGDEALFTMGLIYAHYENPEKDYNKAVSFFKKLIEEYPESTFTEQAKIWVGTLDVIEKEKQVDIEKEKQLDSEKVQEEEKKKKVKVQEQGARKHLLSSQQLLAKGDYQGALRENQKVLSANNKNSSGDRALFNAGLIYAHYENPEKDYKKAINSFKKLIEDYPKSTLVEQAKLWVGTLEIIEQEKQVDIEIEKKKKELEKQVVEREEMSPNSESTTTTSQQPDTPPRPDRVNPAPPSIEAVHRTVLEDEGGSLYFLALNYYKKANETLYELILQANPSIEDVRNIDDRQEIIVPVITAESYIKKIPGGDYRVYIGTFTSYARAAAYSQKVDSAKKLVFIDPHEFSSQETWYRLTVGDFKDKEEALKMVSLLEEKGIIYIPPELDVMEKEKQVDSEKAGKKRELKQQE